MEEINGTENKIRDDVNVSSDLQNKKLTKKGVFIAGIVFFVLVIAMFVVTCCFKSVITDIANSATTPEQGIAVAVALLVLISIFPVILLPMLAFFITSVVLLSLSIKSCIKNIRVASITCLCIDIAFFVCTAALILIWISV